LRKLGYRLLRASSGFQRALRERLTPAGGAILAAAGLAGAAGFDTTQTLTYQAFAFFAALLLLALLSSLFLRASVDCARHLPRYATAGEPVRYTMTLRNQGRATLRDALVTERVADPRPSYEEWRRTRDPEAAQRNWWDRNVAGGFFSWTWLLQRRLPRPLKAVALPAVAPGESCTIGLEIVPRRRGRIELAGLTLGRADPLGLLKGLTRVAAPARITALPKRYRVPQLALPGRRKFQEGGVSLAASIGDSEEFIGLRDYRPGDPLQKVHWKSFARTGKPIVREFQDEFFERHALLLDTGRAAGEDPVFEEAVSLAASFVYTIDTRECLLDLLFVADAVHSYTAGRGQVSAEHLLEVLAGVAPTAPRAFGGMASLARARLAGMSSAILVLVEWDDERRSLAEHLLSAGLELRVFLIRETSVSDAPAWLHVLHPGEIEAGLARLQ